MFYSVIETRDFSLFNQSEQALLKGYFINVYNQVRITITAGTGVKQTKVDCELTNGVLRSRY